MRKEIEELEKLNLKFNNKELSKIIEDFKIEELRINEELYDFYLKGFEYKRLVESIQKIQNFILDFKVNKFKKFNKLLFEWIRKNKYHIDIRPTYKCNYKCSYCVVIKNSRGKELNFNEITAKDWLNIIEKENPKLIYITGGEPTVYPQLAELVNALIDKKYLVAIFTNLSNLKGLKIKKSWRIIWYATYHSEYPLERFKNNLKQYRKKFYVRVLEIAKRGEDYKKRFADSITRPVNEEFVCEKENLYYSPEGELFTNNNDLLDSGIK